MMDRVNEMNQNFNYNVQFMIKNIPDGNQINDIMIQVIVKSS